MSRLAVVGCEASGKTVFMAALADYFRLREDRPERPCLVPENAEANRFAAFLNRQMRVLRQWPPATPPERTSRMDWTLRQGGKTVADVGMIEFGGETFRAAFREGTVADRREAAVAELMEYLSGADHVILLVSLREIFRDQREVSAEEFERETEAQWVTRGLVSFVREKLPRARLVIGLTQADVYRDRLAAAGGGAAAFASYWPSVRAVCAETPVFEVASVSGVDGAGLPAENYDTEGVAPIMAEFLKTIGTSSGKGTAGKGGQSTLRKVLTLSTLVALIAVGAVIALRSLKPQEPAKVQGALKPQEPAKVQGALKPQESLKPLKTLTTKEPLKPHESLKPQEPLKPLKPLTPHEPLKSLTNQLPQAVTAQSQTNQTSQTPKPSKHPNLSNPSNLSNFSNLSNPRAALAALESALRAERVEEAARQIGELAAVKLVGGELERLEQAKKFHQVLASALDGEVAAQNRLANAYFAGTKPVSQDFGKALVWYRLSAEAGDAEAQMCLAVMYEEGKGVAADAAVANEWYRRAAEGGAPDAMYRMGTAVFASRTPESRAEAHEWFEKAKAAGCKIDNLGQWLKATAPKAK